MLTVIWPTWTARAACRDTAHPDQWFASKSSAARAVCAGCSVRVECGEAGRRERFGIWGGLTPGQRRPRRRGRA
jgi:hypothetical protein